jgi:hypothetical protein
MAVGPPIKEIKMTIHHATLKKAESLGYDLTETEDGVEASVGSLKITAHTAKEALALIQQAASFLVEHPWFTIDQSGDLFAIRCDGTILVQNEDLDEAFTLALEEQPEPPEPENLEEPEEPASIVPPKYKNEYKARGDSTRCGDWLCENLDPWVTNTTALRTGNHRRNTNLELLKEVVKANGIDKTWPHLNPGQQAMNARNMLRSKVKKTLSLIIPATVTGDRELTLVPDNEWIASK